MRKSSKIVLVAALIATLGAGVIGVRSTLAAEDSEQPKDTFMSELVTAIAEKFDLDEDEVQAVVDEQREAHKEEMKAKHDEIFETMLATAVEDGDLTQDQADEILEKRDEMQALMESLKDSEEEDRKAAMKEAFEELKAWAEENDIGMEYLRFGPAPRMNNQGQGGGQGQGGQQNGQGMRSGMMMR